MDEKVIDTLKNYKVPQSTIELLNKTKIVFIVGVSGAGKNTILRELLKTDKYHLIISHTTRAPRMNHGTLEQDGKEYHFINMAGAVKMLENNEFIEAKIYSGNIYGTSVAEIKAANEQGKIAISDIEVQGVSEYKKVAPGVIPIFVLPPDFDTWRKRLLSRYVEHAPNPEDFNKRMETAKKELEEALQKDYFEFVVNDDLGRAVTAVDEIANGNLSVSKNENAKNVALQLLSRLE